MKLPNYPKSLMLILAFALAIAIPVSAEQFLYMGIDQSGETSISVVEDTLYYGPLFFRGITQPEKGFTIYFFDSSGGILQSVQAYPDENNIYPFDSRISLIRIVKDGSELSTRQVSFCNSNSVCEPCEEGNCVLMENSFTCSDCPTGSSDYACDLARDSICDPDCQGHDADCPECVEGCWYTDSVQEYTSCVLDFNGVACNPGQLCTGKYVYADNTGTLCCAGGKCIDSEKVVTSTPKNNTGETPSIKTPKADPEEYNPSQETTKTQKHLWLIPLISIILIALLAYFLLRKPAAYK